jgi:hypothetical protein
MRKLPFTDVARFVILPPIENQANSSLGLSAFDFQTPVCRDVAANKAHTSAIRTHCEFDRRGLRSKPVSVYPHEMIVSTHLAT